MGGQCGDHGRGAGAGRRGMRGGAFGLREDGRRMGGDGNWATAIGQYRSGFLLEEVFFWHGVGMGGGGE